MATPEDQIPLKHLPLDLLRRLIERREADAHLLAAGATPPAPSEVDALLATAGLRVQGAPAVDLEPLRGELARRLNEGREVARLRSALYRSHRGVGLQEFRGKLTRQGVERFIVEAGKRLYDETGVPPLYLLAPPRVYYRRLSALYNIYGAAIAGEPVVLTTPYGPVKVLESTLVDQITLV